MTDLTPAWSETRRPAARRRIVALTRTLEREYGTPDLGNVVDPLDEAVYIVLTFQTDIPRARAVWAAFKDAFPTWEAVATATVDAVADVLRPAGLHMQRAVAVKRLLGAVKAMTGAFSLEGLRDLADDVVEDRLCSLPAIDQKSARCIMLYAFGRAAFPVDSNSFRFFVRYGVVSPSARYRRRRLHDDLQALVPPRCRRALHVNLVVHGQRTCRPRTPLCGSCVVRRTCATGKRVTP